MKQIGWLCVVLMAFLVALAPAATVKLKNGTVVEGEVKKMGGSYSVKTKDGTLKLIPANDIDSIDDPTGGVTGPGAPGGGMTTGDFDSVARAADACSNPLIAVTLIQKYIDEHPKGPNLDQAKAELKKWQDMARDGAERIKGKWVTGEELKTLHTKVDSLMREAVEMMVNNQTLKSIEKLQEVIRIYPNCFEAHFELGFFYLVKGGNDQYDKAISSLETAARLRPNSAEALTNLAIAYNFRKNYEKAVTTAYKAVELDDSQPFVQNLVNAISYAPPGMRANNPKVKPIMEQAPLLMAKNHIQGPSDKWTYVRPKPAALERKGGAAPKSSGIVGSGTGFFVSADGYIITNRHVAAAGDQLIVRMADGTQKVAEKVLVDDKQDIAILHIKSEKETPFLRLATYDAPPIGTDVTVLGFPLGAMLGTNVKITRGVVTSVESSGPDCDVIVDAQVNPGNSGGPMVDKFGNAMALVAMKTFTDETVSSYGLGISTGRLRKFFEDQKAKLTALKLTPAEKGTTPLTTEEIAGKYTQATVMILIISGELPEGLK